MMNYELTNKTVEHGSVIDLCERLRRLKPIPSTPRRGGWVGQPRNPDGHEAADALERQAAEIERLQEVVDEIIKLDTGPKIRLRRNGPTDIRIEALKGED